MHYIYLQLISCLYVLHVKETKTFDILQLFKYIDRTLPLSFFIFYEKETWSTGALTSEGDALSAGDAIKQHGRRGEESRQGRKSLRIKRTGSRRSFFSVWFSRSKVFVFPDARLQRNGCGLKMKRAGERQHPCLAVGTGGVGRGCVRALDPFALSRWTRWGCGWGGGWLLSEGLRWECTEGPSVLHLLEEFVGGVLVAVLLHSSQVTLLGRDGRVHLPGTEGRS